MDFKYSFLIGIIMMACSMDNESDGTSDLISFRDSLSAEIMAVHDDVMPKHLELQKLKDQIDKEIESIKEDSVKLDKIKAISDLLDSAYLSMNTWMYEYEPMADTMTREEILDYYSSEREKIDAVKYLMLESLEQAQQQINQ